MYRPGRPLSVMGETGFFGQGSCGVALLRPAGVPLRPARPGLVYLG
jgi:hypothetical protein